MSVLVEVKYKDGTSEVVLADNAVKMRNLGWLEEPTESDKSPLTLEDVYGSDYKK